MGGLVESRPVEPLPVGPAIASPDGLKTIRRHRGPSVTVGAHDQPISTWAKSTIRASPSSWPTDCLSSLAYGWSSRATFLKKPPRRPSTILGMSLLGLALVAGDRLERGPLGVDDVGRDFVAGQVLRTSERDVHGDVVGQLAVAARKDDQHPVDAATTLDVQIAVDDLAVGGFERDDSAELDVLLERDLQVVEAVLPLIGRVRTLGGGRTRPGSGPRASKSRWRPRSRSRI